MTGLLFDDPPKRTGYIEQVIAREGYELIIGLDEAGRGCLAGPLIAAGVAMPVSTSLAGVTDSKALSPELREELAALIPLSVSGSHLEEVSSAEVDRLNILQASLLAMGRCAEHIWAGLRAGGLDIRSDKVLVVVDGPHRIPTWSATPQRAVVSGDALSTAVAAASILAKVHRDAIMEQLHVEHPQYDWLSNKGYGTAFHLKALAAHGLTPHHRRTYAPCRRVLESRG